MARTNRSRTDLHALIRDLDARCRARAAGLPDDTKPSDSWTAVLFLVHKQPFLTPLEQIAEVLELPRDITRIPGTKPWLIGVANNRGILLPIFHLGAFIDVAQPVLQRMTQEPGQDRRREGNRSRERVLVVRQEELPCGLIVSDAIGMRYIKLGDRVDTMPEGLGASKPYVESSFLLDGVPVPVIRLGGLMTDPLFNATMV